MIKNYIILLFFIVGLHVFGQNPQIKTELPEIIPPSPTVSALMKFEEVPVSNYTGIPDISIPLFGSATHSKDINLDVSLKYHSSGIAANERSSDVGLGWSLFAGGTISRTVRGIPDELLILDGSNYRGKVGIYNTSVSNHNNYYYEHMDNYPNFVYQQPYAANEYLWDVVETGKFDTEHDLWQFNFMGKTGRFLIKKNMITNILEVKPLDDYRIIINNNYNQSNFDPISFTIFDEKGYKYIFDVTESTRNSTAIDNTYYYDFPSSVSKDKDFKSAFHLSKVFDPNNNLLIEYNYNYSFSESTVNSIITEADYSIDIRSFEVYKITNCFYEFKPQKRIVNSNRNITVKKISSISVIDYAKIEFDYTVGRLDTNLQSPQNASFLNQLIIKDWNSNVIKKFKLVYDYSTVIDKRLILRNIEILSSSNVLDNKYQLFYKTNNSSNSTIGKDYWGYFNSVPQCESADMTFSNEPSPNFSTTDVLQKMQYPTGGSVIFDFEANQYSYIGNQELTNFDDNKDNFYQSSTSNLSFSNSIQQQIPVSSVLRKVKFYPSLIGNEDPSLNTVTFSLLKLENSIWKNVASLLCNYNNVNCCIDFILESNVQYAIKRNNFDLNYNQTDTMYIEFFTKSSNQKQYLYGGGNRIKQIAYFDADVNQNYFENISNQNTVTPKRNKKYIYTLPGNPNKSSGSLVFPKPLFQYQEIVKTITQCPEPPYYGSLATSVENSVYIVRTNFNNLSVLKTQGADVGYKNVEVYEDGLGKTDYEYTSPIDYPEEVLFSNTPPFLPSKNLDYKRGLLFKEIIYNQNNDPLREINNSYTFDSFEVKYGNRIYKPIGLCFNGAYFSSYSSYEPFITNNQGYFGEESGFNAFDASNLCGYPTEYTQNYPLFEAYGWSKLSNKSTKEFYYAKGSTTPDIVETNESFVYNNLNKQISSHTTKNSLGENLTTNYYYHAGNSIYSQNRVGEIERIEALKSGQLTSESKVNYSNSWGSNVSFLPNTIQTKKGSSSSEIKIRYSSYDVFGNLLEAQQENGIKICYIWGYNQTQPIAKIEKVSYADIQSQVANLQSLSNSGTEANLLAALSTLRNSLPDAMVTTYTYKPLIGVSTITDPKGDKITYIYDNFNRLKEVRDKSNNLLSESEYHYKL